MERPGYRGPRTFSRGENGRFVKGAVDVRPVVSYEPESETVLDLLGDEYARTILRATDGSVRSAAELHEHYELSRPTISRRVNRLMDQQLLTEHTRIDTEGGHHFHVYEAAFDRLVVQLADGEFDVQLELRGDAADRFTRMWHQLRAE
jgi:hypothetical protein